jgi:hypothetical protein
MRILLLISLGLLLAGTSATARPSAVAIGATVHKTTCKTVTKKVHGKNKKVKVCHTVKAAPKPTPTKTATPRPTNTPAPTSTPQPTNTPVPTNTPIPTVLDASTFRLDLSNFPAGTQITKDRVEPNNAPDDTLFAHYGSVSFADEGRTTGYYMDVAQTNGGHPVIFAYRVSIFGTRSQASAAFAQQKAGFDSLIAGGQTNVQSVTSLTGVGDAIASYVDAFNGSSAVIDESNSFFTRGRVMVEVAIVFYADDLDTYGKPGLVYFFKLEQTLDAKARAAGALSLQRSELPQSAMISHTLRSLASALRQPRVTVRGVGTSSALARANHVHVQELAAVHNR